MAVADLDERDYIVYAARREGGKGAFYFWTGQCFTGDMSQAKIHPRYADCIDTIWHGVLWDETKKVEKLGFKTLRAIPLAIAQEEIKPEWRGKQTFVLS